MLANRKTITAITLMVVAAFFSIAAAVGDNDVFRSKAKYMKYVGTYYTDNGQMVTLHSDGTQITVQAGMFSEDSSLGGMRRRTPALGVWRKVGENEIQITNIRFYTDSLGSNYQPDGLIFKATFVAVFDKPVRGQSLGFTVGSVLGEFFKPDQNPVTDEPVGVFTLTDGYEAYRLETEQPGS